MQFLGISGSLRKGSHNYSLLEAIAACVEDGDQFTIFERAKHVPVFDEDIEANGMPDAVAELQDAVRRCDIVIFSTPEYNQSLAGSTKNLLDWISRDPEGSPLIGKPCAVTGATVGSWGTRIAQSQLITVLYACGALVLPPRHFVAKAGVDTRECDTLTGFFDEVRQAARGIL